MRLQESGEMYLETIYILSQTTDFVRAVDVSEYMNYSKPSVSRAMGLLKNADLICVATDGKITLTDEGRKIACRTYERHVVLTECFEKIGVPHDIAAEDACKVEHDISDETFEAIKKHLLK